MDTPKPFAEHAGNTVKGITSLYRLAEDVLIEPDYIEASRELKILFKST